MNPVYDVDGIQIWHADCADVLPTIDPATVDLLLTDPPYGIAYSGGSLSGQRWDSIAIAGDSAPFDATPLFNYQRWVVWGGNYVVGTPPSAGWIVWSKAQDNRWLMADGNHRSTGEMAATNLTDKVLIYNCFWAGSPLYRKSERGSSLHPTQKPVEIMRWIVEKWTEPGDLVLDPYMGSGPVARACADLGRRYIGIEIVEEYVDAAIGRLGQLTLDVNR